MQLAGNCYAALGPISSLLVNRHDRIENFGGVKLVDVRKLEFLPLGRHRSQSSCAVVSGEGALGRSLIGSANEQETPRRRVSPIMECSARPLDAAQSTARLSPPTSAPASRKQKRRSRSAAKRPG